MEVTKSEDNLGGNELYSALWKMTIVFAYQLGKSHSFELGHHLVYPRISHELIGHTRMEWVVCKA